MGLPHVCALVGFLCGEPEATLLEHSIWNCNMLKQSIWHCKWAHSTFDRLRVQNKLYYVINLILPGGWAT